VKKLISLAETEGSRQDDGWIRINASLTQFDLAQLIGATRETVNLGFKRLFESGAADRVKGRIIVKPDLLLKAISREAEGGQSSDLRPTVRFGLKA
jgi:hypothetical protein